MTRSEVLFERFCRERGIEFKRLPLAETRTPDYEITAGAVRAVVEVKQVEPNPKEQALLSELRRRGKASHWVNMWRPRQAIREAAKQLRAYGGGSMPGIAVLFDAAGGVLGSLGADSIAQALYGQRRIHVGASPDRHGEIVGVSLGGWPVASATRNTELSAVAVLRLFQNDGLFLTMFHNQYATIPLNPNDLRIQGVDHLAWSQNNAAIEFGWTYI
jgi:hypothetical protein